MPIEFENSQAGGATDISGVPAPSRPLSSTEVRQATAGRVGHTQAGPRNKVQQERQQPTQQDSSPIPSSDTGQQPQQKGAGMPAPQANDDPFADWSPVDWGKVVEHDAEGAWNLARRGYQNMAAFIDPNRATQAVSLAMQADNARMNAIQQGYIGVQKANAFVLGGLDAVQKRWDELVNKALDPNAGPAQAAAAIALRQTIAQFPGGSIYQAAANAPSAFGAATGKISPEEAAQQAEKTDTQVVQQAPGDIAQAALMETGVGAAGAASRAAMGASVAAPIISQLLSTNPDEQHHALIWGALMGGLFGVSHLGPLREPLMRVLGERWPQIEQWMQQAQDVRQKADEAGMDPKKQSQQVIDHIKQALEIGAMEPYSAVVKRAAGAEKEVPAMVGPGGEVRLMAGEAAKKLKKGLEKSVGVSDVEGLLEKARAEGGLSGKAAKFVAKHWGALGMQYDLRATMPGEGPPRDPQLHLANIADEDLHARVVDHIASLNSYLGEIKRGLFVSGEHPAASILRNLAGQTRGNLQRVDARWRSTLFDALGEWGTEEGNGVALGKAVEGDVEAYDSLPPEAKAIADGFGLVRATLRDMSQNTKYAKNFVPNWFPRVDMVKMLLGRGRPTTGTVLAREARKQRALALSVDPITGELQQTLRHPTVQSTNEALSSARSYMQAQILSDAKLPSDLENDAEVQNIRTLMATGNFAEAEKRAAQLAFDRYPSKDENFLRAINAVGYQARSILTAQAIEELKKATVMGTHLRSGTKQAMKALVQPENPRHAEELQNMGYVKLGDSKFRGVLAERNFAKLLDRYVSHVGEGGLATAPVAKQALAVERQMVKYIMYSPAIHGVNMLGRFFMGATVHPIDFINYLFDGKEFGDPTMADARERMAAEPYSMGLMPDYKKSQFLDNALGSMHDALGDIESDMPEMQMNSRESRLGSLIQQVMRPYEDLNRWFWGKVNDFGVMMYWLEKKDALAAGRSEEEARMWGMRRGNSWMGAVAPEDTNPNLHAASRLLAFAPNWWRTWAELMVPIYKRSGLFTDSKMATFAAKQAAKTAMSAFLFQKMSGNALNLFMSGHLQDQNQLGQQDRIEITNPTVIRAMQAARVITSDPHSSQYIDPNTGTNERTGAVLAMENPFARQQFATEQMLGLQSGQSGWTPGELTDGLTTFAVSRTSPLLDSLLAGAFNLDLYGSATSGTARGVIQDQPVGRPNPLSPLVAALYSLPGAQQFSYDMQQPQDPTHPQSNVSILGTQLPKGLSDAVRAIPNVGARTVLSGMMGVNPPTARAQKTPGQQLSDADYQKIQQANTDYQKAMQTNDLQAWSGQETPYQWRLKYSVLSKDHTAFMKGIYQNAPQYVNGGDALASGWDALYDKATLADGSIDQARLSQLQAQFTSDHTKDQMQQMHAILRQNDTRYPMLAMYHQVLDGYNAWQENWARRSGIDIIRLRGEIAAYNSLYSRGPAIQHQYLAAHPELAIYRGAVKAEWDQSAMGLAYSLFYGQQAAIRRATALNISEQQLQQGVERQAATQQPGEAA